MSNWFTEVFGEDPLDERARILDDLSKAAQQMTIEIADHMKIKAQAATETKEETEAEMELIRELKQRSPKTPEEAAAWIFTIAGLLAESQRAMNRQMDSLSQAVDEMGSTIDAVVSATAAQHQPPGDYDDYP